MNTLNPFVRQIRKASDRGAQHIRRMARERSGLIQQGTTFFRRATEQQYRAIIERSVAGASSGVAAIQAVRETRPPQTPVQKALQQMYEAAGRRFGAVGEEIITGEKRLRKSDNYVQRVRDYLERVGGEKITQISDTTRQDIVRILQNMVDEGEGIEAMAQTLREHTDGVSLMRGRRIARTEVIPASNAAVDAGAREADVALEKEWITAIDGREREHHKEADGQVVDMDSLFRVDHEELEFPGDTSHGASAGNVINCRCAHAPVPAGSL